MFRGLSLLVDLARNAFGVSEAVVTSLPLYQQMLGYRDEEVEDLVRLRILCFARSTLLSNASGIKKFIKFCGIRKVDPFPVNVNLLQLCILKLANDGCSYQIVEKTVRSVVFVANLFGLEMSAKDQMIHKALKFS